MSYLFDTNIFLEILLDQDKKKEAKMDFDDSYQVMIAKEYQLKILKVKDLIEIKFL